MRRPGLGHDGGDAAVALEALDVLAAVDLDAVVGQHLLEVPARGLAEVRSSVTSSCITIVHLAADRGQRRRDLGGDVGAADEHDVLGVLGVLADRCRRCRSVRR